MMKPKTVTLSLIGEDRLGVYLCHFCSQPATKKMQRVYSFGINSDLVCDDCGRDWSKKASGDSS